MTALGAAIRIAKFSAAIAINISHPRARKLFQRGLAA